MAPENAANATPPPKTARGPAFRASMPPATKPAATGLTMSFFARYYQTGIAWCAGLMCAHALEKCYTHRFYHTLDASEEGADLSEALSAPPHSPAHLFEYLRRFLRSCQVVSH